MQPINIEQYANSSGWHVIHNADTHLYKIVNTKGRELKGSYTSRIFADKGLDTYLASLEKINPTKNKK